MVFQNDFEVPKSFVRPIQIDTTCLDRTDGTGILLKKVISNTYSSWHGGFSVTRFDYNGA